MQITFWALFCLSKYLASTLGDSALECIVKIIANGYLAVGLIVIAIPLMIIGFILWFLQFLHIYALLVAASFIISIVSLAYFLFWQLFRFYETKVRLLLLDVGLDFGILFGLIVTPIIVIRFFLDPTYNPFSEWSINSIVQAPGIRYLSFGVAVAVLLLMAAAITEIVSLYTPVPRWISQFPVRGRGSTKRRRIGLAKKGLGRIMDESHDTELELRRDLTPTIYQDLQNLQCELEYRRARGQSPSALFTYLESTKARYRFKVRTREAEAIEKFCLQLTRALDAGESLYKTHERAKTLEKRAGLERDAEFARLQAEKEKAEGELERARVVDRLKLEKERIELTAQVQAAQEQAKLEAKIAQLEAQKRQLQAELDIDKIKKQSQAKSEEPKSPELKGSAKEWAEAQKQYKLMIEQGMEKEVADKWLEGRQRTIFARERMKGI